MDTITMPPETKDTALLAAQEVARRQKAADDYASLRTHYILCGCAFWLVVFSGFIGCILVLVSY